MYPLGAWRILSSVHIKPSVITAKIMSKWFIPLNADRRLALGRIVLSILLQDGISCHPGQRRLHNVKTHQVKVLYQGLSLEELQG